MSPATAVLLHIERAEHHVRQAHDSWSAAQPERCIECLRHLQEAVSEMHQAQRAVVPGMGPAEARGRLERLRQDIGLLGKLVDAANAFYRGLAFGATMEEPAHSAVEG